MCGRYALGIRASFVRRQLQERGLLVDEAPPDEEVRETYNFAPGHYGLVYRADVPDQGLRNEDESDALSRNEGAESDALHESTAAKGDASHSETTSGELSSKIASEDLLPGGPDRRSHNDIRYHLKAMKWGLIPFWTKRSPDYGSMMRTINCRDDSLIENRGMWNTMKQRKRCVVTCQGFYEWLKKGPGGKEKIPHFVKRKDGELMCFAGLWDCVKYEDAEDKVYTYTIITTDSNQQLKFLHDRMPVVLEPGSKAMKTWLDPNRKTWSKELQSMLKPYDGELECYPVSKEVGKVGNNSPDFIVPIDSKENKNNIVNFFGNAAKKNAVKREGAGGSMHGVSKEAKDRSTSDLNLKQEKGENRETKDHEGSEDNAPIPVPKGDTASQTGIKRSRSPEDLDIKPSKALKKEVPSPEPAPESTTKRKTRSATSNGTQPKSPSKKAGDGSQRITNFFTK